MVHLSDIKISGANEQSIVSFSSLLNTGIVLESISQENSLLSLRRFSPKSDYEVALHKMIRKYNPIFSHIVYLLFKKLKSYPILKAKPIASFFLELEVLYVFHLAIEMFDVKQDDKERFFSNIIPLAKRYFKIIEKLYFFLGTDGNDIKLDRSNIYDYVRSFRSINLEFEISQFLKEFAYVKNEFDQVFFDKNLSDPYELMASECSSLLDGNYSLNKENSSKKLNLISFHPCLWANEDLSVENITTSFITKRLEKNSYQMIKNKNLFYYYFEMAGPKKESFMNAELNRLFLLNIMHSGDESAIKEIFRKDFENKTLKRFTSFINSEQLELDELVLHIKNTFSFEKDKVFSEDDLSRFFLQSVEYLGKMFAYHEKFFLLYSKALEKDKDLVLKLSHIIKASLKDQQSKSAYMFSKKGK